MDTGSTCKPLISSIAIVIELLWRFRRSGRIHHNNGIARTRLATVYCNYIAQSHGHLDMANRRSDFYALCSTRPTMRIFRYREFSTVGILTMVVQKPQSPDGTAKWWASVGLLGTSACLSTPVRGTNIQKASLFAVLLLQQKRLPLIFIIAHISGNPPSYHMTDEALNERNCAQRTKTHPYKCKVCTYCAGCIAQHRYVISSGFTLIK